MPDWGKIEFHKYPGNSWDEILKGASSNGRDLVSHLVRYESSQRYSAAEVCGPTSSIILEKYARISLTFRRR